MPNKINDFITTSAPFSRALDADHAKSTRVQGAEMKIVGCDFHPDYQQIMVLDSMTGEMVEKTLSHERKEEVRAFYAGLGGSV